MDGAEPKRLRGIENSTKTLQNKKEKELLITLKCAFLCIF